MTLKTNNSWTGNFIDVRDDLDDPILRRQLEIPEINLEKIIMGQPLLDTPQELLIIIKKGYEKL